MNESNKSQEALVLAAGEGRVYDMGAMTAIFKADGIETDNKYSISEWWLEPYADGSGEHQHDDQDQIFYILEGTVSIFVTDKWIEAGKGTFIRIPRNTLHNFANRTDKKAGMLNVDIPGGFEKNMPAIVKWFEENK